MKLYVILDIDGNLLHVGTTPIGENPIEVEVPEDCCIFDNPSLYYFDGKTLVKKEQK